MWIEAKWAITFLVSMVFSVALSTAFRGDMEKRMEAVAWVFGGLTVAALLIGMWRHA